MRLGETCRNIAKSLFIALKRRSWIANSLGAILIAVGGVVANATASVIFKNVCKVEGEYCFAGVRYFFLHTYEGVSIICGTLLAILGAFLSYSDKNEIDRLRDDVSNLTKSVGTLEKLNNELEANRVDVRSVIAVLLQRLHEKMNFGSSERISAYLVGEDKFFIAGRYSLNPDFHKIHRNYYPKGQGIIDKARLDGWSTQKIVSPSEKTEKYAQEHVTKCGISVEVARKFTMKSRCYAAISVVDQTSNHPIAIICFESTNRNKLDLLNREIVMQSVNHIVPVIEALAPQAIWPNDALNEGL